MSIRLTSTSIFKLPEHLESYYKIWSERRNEKDSLANIDEDYRRIQELLRVQQPPIIRATLATPQTLSSDLSRAPKVSTLETRSDVEGVTQWEVSYILNQHKHHQNRVQYTYAPEQQQQRKRKAADLHSVAAEAPGPSLSGSQSGPIQPVISTRAPRTCVRCKSANCAGKWSAKKCETLPGHAGDPKSRQPQPQQKRPRL